MSTIYRSTFFSVFTFFLIQVYPAFGQGTASRSFPISNTRIIHDSIPHPGWTGEYVHCFRPGSGVSPLPVVLFCHGIGATDPATYSAFISHMVERGSSVIYAPYGMPTAMMQPQIAYRAMWDGFVEGVKHWGDFLDVDRLGVVGHSYGAGAVPFVASKAWHEKGWGKENLFLYAMAPWYMHGVRFRSQRSFPSHTKMVVQVFENDIINDHRMGKDMYKSLSIAVEEKLFMILKSNWQGHHMLVANHNVPAGSFEEVGSVDALDSIGVYRVFDELSRGGSSSLAQAFSDVPESDGNTASRKVARAFLVKERRPRMERSQPYCLNFWYHAMNPRTRFFRRLAEPARVVLHTPVTIWNYAMLVPQYLGR